MGSEIPQRASALVYSLPGRLVKLSSNTMERKLTHLGERSRACVDLAPKDGEPEEGAFKDEVDEGIEGLRSGQGLVHYS